MTEVLKTRIRVWDIPVRVFHWSLVICILGLFITAQLGGNWMEWHKKFGFVVLGLVSFRIVWGFAGSYHARFVNFVRGPQTVIGYFKGLLKNEAPHFLGHNPMGALSVVVLLASLLFQAVTGLFSNDDILLEGPYASVVSKATSDFLTKLHHLNSDLLLILIGVHLAAIAFYFFKKKENLVKPMLNGEKTANSSIDGHFEAEMTEKPRPVWTFWVIAIAVGGATYAVVTKVFMS
jgi:cytochrome b